MVLRNCNLEFRPNRVKRSGARYRSPAAMARSAPAAGRLIDLSASMEPWTVTSSVGPLVGTDVDRARQDRDVGGVGCLVGVGSSTVPPATTERRPVSRRMKRSPIVTGTGMVAVTITDGVSLAKVRILAETVAVPR